MRTSQENGVGNRNEGREGRNLRGGKEKNQSTGGTPVQKLEKGAPGWHCLVRVSLQRNLRRGTKGLKRKKNHSNQWYDRKRGGKNQK